MKLEKGDLVCITPSTLGMTNMLVNQGTFIAVYKETDIYVGIDFGPGFSGHTLEGAITTETGWWIDRERFNVSLYSLENE